MRLSIVSKKIIVAILFASVLLFSLYCFGKKCAFSKLTNLLTIIYKKSSQKPGTLPVAKKEVTPLKSSTESASSIEKLTRSIRSDAIRGVDVLVETLNI
jgi:hypothetical protein